MPGWNLKSGELNRVFVSEDEYWAMFNFVYSDSCLKRNTYKYELIKSIMDNLFNCGFENESGVYYLTYKDIFYRFAVNYWNLVLKYHLKQMRPDGKSTVSKIESILLEHASVNDAIKGLEFSSLRDEAQTDIGRLLTRYG